MLSIIIVNYRSAGLIKNCLETVYAYNADFSFEVIIVDNDSQDASRAILTESFPTISWIEMGYNSGFARANNAGIKASQYDTILLLNPDTLAIDDAIKKCFYKLKESEFVAAGVQLLNPDRSLQISGSFFVKGGLNHLLPIPYWGNFIRWLGYRTRSKVPHIKNPTEVDIVDWINGAFLMVKKDAIAKAGLLDEDFFLYSEEIEWCSRLQKTGPLCIFGHLQMIHLQGESVNKSQNSSEKGYENLFNKKGLQLMVSHHVRIRKQYGIFWFLFLLINYTWGILVFLIASSVNHLIHLRNPFRDWQKVGQFAKNVFRIWQLSLIIIKNKPHFYKMF